jgi:predicted transglutaminase-like cysteine proteinase
MNRPRHILSLSIIAALLGLMAPMTAVAMPNPFFALKQTEANTDLAAFTKWTSIMPRYEQEREAADTKCTNDYCPTRQWEKLLGYLENKSTKEKVDAVNRFFNAMTYISDQDNYGVDDYWQTPYELMARGGDCEDYAIAKFISLKRLGVSEDDMRILIVRDAKLGGIIHAILEVNIDGVAYILDNQSPKVKTAASIYRYHPVYAINERRWWAYQA